MHLELADAVGIPNRTPGVLPLARGLGFQLIPLNLPGGLAGHLLHAGTEQPQACDGQGFCGRQQVTAGARPAVHHLKGFG